MDPIQKALWFVESHSREPILLEDIAKACKVSAFHLTRAFATTTGLSLMRYVCARRLSEAAKVLSLGAEDILRVALDAGYGSHEAFTRAFRDQFALTPEQVRAQGHITNIEIVEAIAMNPIPVRDVAPQRLETLKPLIFAGLVERYHCESHTGIPDQWQRFTPYLGNLPGQTGDSTYGVSFNFDSDGNFDYMCGVEVTDVSGLPKGIQSLQVPSQTFAIFLDTGHIAGIRAMCAAIWTKWLPESGYKAAEAPTLERYGKEFNPMTGMGGYEIWIPIQT